MYDAPLLSCATKDRAGRRRSSTYRKARPSQATPAAPEVAEPRLLSCSEELATAVLLSPDLLLVVFDSLGLGVCLGTLARVCGVWLEAAKARARAWRTLAPSHEIAVPYDDGKRSHPTFAISLPTPAGGLCVADSKNHQLHLVLPASRAVTAAAAAAAAVAAAAAGEGDGAEVVVPMVGGASRFKWPAGMTTDGEGHLFVVDCRNHRVQKLRLDDGALLASTSGAQGSGEAQLEFPQGVALDGGELYVGDTFNHRVSVYDAADLRHVRSFGREGHGAGELSTPCAVAASRGRLYVVEQTNHRLQLFAAASGESRRIIGGRGVAPGRFLQPRGVALAHGRLYVSEHQGERVQVLTEEGVPLQLLALPGCGPLAGLCADGPFRMVVPEPGRSRLHVLHVLQAPTAAAAATAACAAAGAAANAADAANAALGAGGALSATSALDMGMSSGGRATPPVAPPALTGPLGRRVLALVASRAGAAAASHGAAAAAHADSTTEGGAAASSALASAASIATAAAVVEPPRPRPSPERHVVCKFGGWRDSAELRGTATKDRPGRLSNRSRKERVAGSDASTSSDASTAATAALAGKVYAAITSATSDGSAASAASAASSTTPVVVVVSVAGPSHPPPAAPSDTGAASRAADVPTVGVAEAAGAAAPTDADAPEDATAPRTTRTTWLDARDVAVALLWRPSTPAVVLGCLALAACALRRRGR